MPSRSQPARTAGLLLLLTPLIWGGTFPAAKVALEHLSPWTFMAWSRGLGLAALVPILALWRPRGDAWRPSVWMAGLGLGVLMNLGYALQTVGIAHTTATDAGFITVLYVVFAPLGAAVLARRLPSPVTALCVAMSFAGLALLSLHGAHLQAGDALVLGAAVAFACHILLIDRLLVRFDAIALATAQTAGSALVALVVPSRMGRTPAGWRRCGASSCSPGCWAPVWRSPSRWSARPACRPRGPRCCWPPRRWCRR